MTPQLEKRAPHFVARRVAADAEHCEVIALVDERAARANAGAYGVRVDAIFERAVGGRLLLRWMNRFDDAELC